MQPKPLIKQIKRIPFIFLALILVSASFKFVSDWRSIGSTRLLEVRISDLKERTYKRVELGENSFTTGMEGQLYWKVRNSREAFLVGMADRDRLISYFDVLYFLLLDACLFFMVYRMNEETIFSEQIGVGLKVVIFCIIFYPIITLMGNYLSDLSVQKLTGYKFRSQHQSFSASKFQLISYLLVFMYPFLQKAINLQKEQDLTI